MKKRIGLALLAAVVGLGQLGCPDKKVDDSIAPANAPYVIEEVLREFDLEVSASLDDVNGDGDLDYYVRYTGGGPVSTDLLGRLLAGVTVSLREVTRRSSFYADTAFLEIGSDVYQAQMTDLFDCEASTSSPDAEAECLLQAWKKTSQEYGRGHVSPFGR